MVSEDHSITWSFTRPLGGRQCRRRNVGASPVLPCILADGGLKDGRARGWGEAGKRESGQPENGHVEFF